MSNGLNSAHLTFDSVKHLSSAEFKMNRFLVVDNIAHSTPSGIIDYDPLGRIGLVRSTILVQIAAINKLPTTKLPVSKVCCWCCEF